MSPELETEILSRYFGTEECLQEKEAGAIDVAGRIAAAALLLSLLDSSRQKPHKVEYAERQLGPTIRALEKHQVGQYSPEHPFFYAQSLPHASYMQNVLSPLGRMHPLSPHRTNLRASEDFVRSTMEELPPMSDLSGWDKGASLRDSNPSDLIEKHLGYTGSLNPLSPRMMNLERSRSFREEAKRPLPEMEDLEEDEDLKRLGEASAKVLEKKAFFFQAAKNFAHFAKPHMQFAADSGAGKLKQLKYAMGNTNVFGGSASSPGAFSHCRDQYNTSRQVGGGRIGAAFDASKNTSNALRTALPNSSPATTPASAPTPAANTAQPQSGGWAGKGALIGAGALAAFGIPKVVGAVLDYGQKEQTPTPWSMQPYGGARLNQDVNQYGQPMP